MTLNPNTTRLLAIGAVLLVAVIFLSTCVLGGDDENGGSGTSTSSVPRGSIPTATQPANLPEPVILGETQASGGISTPNAGNGATTYTVLSGDTLFGIATKLNISSDQQSAWASEVLRLNGIADASQLAPGVVLRLPVTPTTTSPNRTATPAAAATTAGSTPTRAATAATSTPAAAATAASAATTAGSGGTYTVQSGDYPLSIAQKLGASNPSAYAAQIVALNGVNASNLTVGQVLQLPPLN